MRIVLVNPLIPPNTGSVGRLCAATNTPLWLVEPLGFSLEDKYLKRAGLDYWPWIDLHVTPSLDEALDVPGRAWLFTAHATQAHTAVTYGPDDALVLGTETTGLPDELLQARPDDWVRIPMDNPNIRSLNLAQCAAVALFEARRQLGR
ncbi:MAG: tRNA (cytidine(34)-2'-O)-methyltransferase [Myxococcales bacterium]|nr:tRNA (cytidine(34)-2'-O)-methyltransferase [Myxococcales bacterium]